MWRRRPPGSIIYYAQRNYYLRHGRYTEDPAVLQMGLLTGPEGFVWPPVVETTRDLFQVRIDAADGVTSWNIDQHGRVRRLPEKED